MPRREWHYRTLSSGVGGSVTVGRCPVCECLVFTAEDGVRMHEAWHAGLEQSIRDAANAQAVPPPQISVQEATTGE